MAANISISPDELMEHSKNIVKYTESNEENMVIIEDAIGMLSDWNSSNKQLFTDKVVKDLKEMREMNEAGRSYGLVGSDVASRVLGVENAIRETLLKEDV